MLRITLAALCLHGQTARGQNPEAPPPAQTAAAGDLEEEFLVRTWESLEDGLLPTYLRSITQTRDGNLWLGAFDGLVQFDGFTGLTLSAANTPVFPRPLQGDIAHADAAGRLWCSTITGGLFCRENGIWARRQDWSGGMVTRFSEGPDGELMISTAGPPVRFLQGQLSPLAWTGPLAGKDPVNAVAEFDQAGTLWLLTGEQLYRREAGNWAAVSLPANVTALARGRKSGMWLAMRDRIFHLDGAAAASGRGWPLPADFAGGPPPLLLEDSRENLWIAGQGAGGGLRVILHDGRMLEPRRRRGDAPVRVTCLFEDRERNILAGTAGAGLARFRPIVFDLVLARRGGLAGIMVNAVAPAPDGRMFLATMGGGLVLSTAKGETETVTPDLSPPWEKPNVTSLATAPDGSLLAAFLGRGLQRVRDGRAEAVPGSDSLGPRVVRALLEKEGLIHIGCDDGFFLLREGRLEPVAAMTEGVTSIVEDSAGKVWVGAGPVPRHVGVDGSVVSAPVAGQPVEGRIVAMRAAAGGGMWVSWLKGGIARVRGGVAEWFARPGQLPVEMVGGIVETADALWLSGEKGIMRLPLHPPPGAPGERPPLRLFTRFDGLASDLFRRGNQATAAMDGGGKIWFASHKGAAVIDPGKVLTSAYEVPARVESVHSDLVLKGVPVTASNRDSLELPAGSRHLWLACAIPTTSQPDLPRMEYKLEGFGGSWTDTEGERLVRFYNLPPGTYQFLLRSTGSDGFHAGPVEKVTIRLLPYFWQTTWFRLSAATAAALTLGLLVWLIATRRMARNAARLEALAEGNQLKAALAEARQAEAIGRLAGGIAHDFNNLLTAILGNAELARIEHGSNPALCRQLEDIAGAGVRARDLISQILSYSKSQRTEMRPVDLAPVFHESLRLLRSGMPSSVVLDQDIPPALPLVMADPAEIQRVLLNLGGNAAQALGPVGGIVGFRASFCLPGQPCLEPWGHITPDGCVLLTVEDNGHGMDDTTLDKIFDPFFTTKDVGRGTGLGLAVVRGIVESHGGHVTVTSALGRGSAFHVVLPICQAPQHTAPEESPGDTKTPERYTPSRGAGERVLVVDDEEQVLEISRRTLVMLGYDPVACGSPEEAARLFEQAPGDFKLAILDFAMPGMNGAELARFLRGLHPTIPIILCTGYGGAIDPEAARGINVARVLAKPYQMEVFAATVASALREAPTKK